MLPLGPTAEHRVLQLHPTRRCNLRCLHCYSDSGPDRSEELDERTLREAISDAAREGYTVAGFSGGEPLLYGGLPRMLDHAHAFGLTTTVTTNGIPLTERRIDALTGRADLLAISLDGMPSSHNRMRAHGRAFELMSDRLPAVRRSGIPFGFIFTLTQHNVNELDWVARFAVEQGAGLLQVHPLENVGRARGGLPGERPDGTESMFAQLEAVRLREQLAGRLSIQVDIVDSHRIGALPERLFAGPALDWTRPFGELVSPLVIEADGAVVPLQYGFARRFSLGNLQAAPLPELIERWRAVRMPEFRHLCEQVFDELGGAAAPRFANWYEAIGERADAWSAAAQSV